MHNRFNILSLILLSVFFLTIPSQAISNDWVYSIKEGDTLWGLSSKYLLNRTYIKKLQELNNIPDSLALPVGSTIKIPTTWLKKPQLSVSVDAVQGKAEVIKKSTGVSSLKQGELIVTGDSITTQKNSSVVLKFIDNTRVLIEENSTLEVELLEKSIQKGTNKTKLNLKKGRLEIQVNPNKKPNTKFIIKTPVSVTSVRGTKYRVSAIPKDAVSHTEVIEGAVEVSNAGKSQLIPMDFGSVTLANTPPMSPIALLNPPNIDAIPKVFGLLPIQFTLPSLKNDQSYRIQVAKTVKFQQMLFNKTFLSPSIQLPNLPDAHYQVRIRRIDHHGLEGKNIQFQLIVKTEPKAPALLEPKSNEAFFNKQPDFSWREIKMAKGYHFQLSKTADFSELLIDHNNMTLSQLDLSVALKEGKYFWQVATIDSSGQGIFSTPQTFYIKLQPPKALSIKVLEKSLTVDFNQNLAVGQKYHLQVAEDESFTKLLTDKQFGLEDLKLSLSKAGKYYTRIRVIGKNGNTSPFTVPQLIEVAENAVWPWFVFIFLLISFVFIYYVIRD